MHTLLIAENLGRNVMNELFEIRAKYSETRIDALQAAIEKRAAPIKLEGLTIFTVGSYGRLEASEHSDIDLFFVYGPKDDPDGAEKPHRNTNEIRLFGRLIDIVEEQGFPPLSNDAQFLESHKTSDVLMHLGSRYDDSKNYFTTRMLLLLESRCLYGEGSYDQVVEEILNSYYRDYPGHEENFRPWFLLNDIMRFWKTLLLNYENKRHLVSDDEKTKQRVKNFKLKFSRVTTCFATIAAVGANSARVDLNEMKSIVRITPRERLLRVADQIPALGATVTHLLEEYSWFLTQTALTTEDLQAIFENEEGRRRHFDRAERYVDSLYKMILEIDAAQDQNFLRSLVL